MLLRSLIFVPVAALMALPAVTAPVAAQSAPTMTIDELMRATALDEVFSQFGATVEASPAEQGAPFTSAMETAWAASAQLVFDADAMHADLAAMLEVQLTDADTGPYAAFFGSPFGLQIAEIERAVTLLSPERQLDARDEGLVLAGRDDPRRGGQIDEMLELISADIAMAMVRQSMRGLLIGMSVTGQQGDIKVPWDEIDAHIDAIMPEIEADVARTQRAIMFYAYRDLSEDELEHYLEFLRTEPAQRLYALAAFSIGSIVTERMEMFGEALSRHLARVAV